MASTIITRTISAVTETAVSMVNSSWARPITLPSTWSKVRVGVRLHIVPGSALDSSVHLGLGLGSGTAAIIGDVSTTNFIGVVWGGNWTNDGSKFTNIQPFPATRVGTTLTLGSALDNNNTKFISGNVAATADRVLFFVDITKGSPNFTIDTFAATAAGDQSAATFLAQVQSGAPALVGYSFATNGAKTIAFSESNGVLNTAQCWWNNASASPEICDLAVVLLA